jgi:hypothetical protein
MSDKTIQQKIEDLRSIGFHIEPVEDKYRVFFEKKNSNNPLWASSCGLGPTPEVHLYSAREVAKEWKIRFEKGQKCKELLKTIGKGKDRAKTRDLIKQEDFDKIPLNERVDRDNLWNYD